MKTDRLLAMTFVLAFAAGFASAQDTRPPFVVHEWGTFTSMQGHDGTSLDGLHHEEERLPEFVYSRTKVRECPYREYGYKGLEVPVTHAFQKMETPVIYFHTSEKLRARVRVEFRRGLITQWYPVSNLLGPPEKELLEGPLDLASVDSSFLEWDIDLIPRSADRPPFIPNVPADDPWSFAREVDSAWVQTLPRRGEKRMGPVEAEHYLFYRGLGTFELPVTAKTADAFDNAGDLEIPAAFALEVDADRARFRSLGSVAARSECALGLDGAEWMALEDVTKSIHAAMLFALDRAGLHADEANAMIKTWSRSWFSTPGRRVMWLLPSAWIDDILPLEISPKPDKTVRVLVGRLEIITEAREAKVLDALRLRLSEDAEIRTAAMKTLASFDRFLEPHLKLVLSRSKDADVVRSAKEVLAGFGSK